MGHAKKLFCLIFSVFLVLVTLGEAFSKEVQPKVVKNPSPEDSSGFVLLADVIPDIIQEIRYYSTYNFVGKRVAGYNEPCALLTSEAAYALKGAAEEVRKMGYVFKIYDSYRPQMAVDNFVAWAKSDDVSMKPYFYPEKNKNVLFKEGYIDAKSGHSRGSTLDLTLVDMKKGKELDMGGTFDYFGERSHYAYRGNLTPEQIKNRQILHDLMYRHGFKGISEEWWHFTLKDEPYPNTYFTFPVSKLYAEVEYWPSPSPDWVAKLPEAQNAKHLFVVAAVGKTTAWVSMHNKNADGSWVQIMTTPGFIGREGLGKTREGDDKTPVGTYKFNRAFGLAKDPGCKIPYVQADENTYWSGDVRPGHKYNELVDIRSLPDLDKEKSERIIDYTPQYRYCLHISYNEKGTPEPGFAIFLDCLDAKRPFTDGSISIPKDMMRFVMQNVDPDCVVIINSLEELDKKEAK